MNFGILPKLTKDYILTHASEESIMEYYLGIPVVFNELVCSTLRVDPNPTCGFAYRRSDGRLVFRDFAGYFHGDCFDVVAYKLNLDANNSRSFMLILETIAKDFGLHKYKRYGRRSNQSYTGGVSSTSKKTAPLFVDIKFNYRKWNNFDFEVWGKYKFPADYLENTCHIYPASSVFVRNQLVYVYTPDNPAYVYVFGRDAQGRDLIKVYYPLAKPNRKTKRTIRFIQNSSLVEGISTLQESENCIITKSYKDVSGIRFHNDRSIIESVGVASESTVPSPSEIDYIRAKCKNVYSLMDDDPAGIMMINSLLSLYDIPGFVIPTQTLTEKRLDYTDLLEMHGVTHATNFITNLITDKLPMKSIKISENHLFIPINKEMADRLVQAFRDGEDKVEEFPYPIAQIAMAGATRTMNESKCKEIIPIIDISKELYKCFDKDDPDYHYDLHYTAQSSFKCLLGRMKNPDYAAIVKIKP